MLAKTILKRILHFRSQTMKYPQPLAALSSAFLLTVLLAGCSTPPWGGTAKPEGVPLVILDTDIGSSTDDLFALEMLFRYEEAGKCRLLGVVVDRPGEANAAFADAMNTWAGRPDRPPPNQAGLPAVRLRHRPADVGPAGRHPGRRGRRRIRHGRTRHRRSHRGRTDGLHPVPHWELPPAASRQPRLERRHP